MEDHDPEKRLDDLAESIMDTYVFMSALLAELPLPIILPVADPDDWDPTTALQAVDRARRELIAAEPVSEKMLGLLERLTLNWLNAYELGGFMTIAGVTPWRLDGAEQEIADVLRLAVVVARELQE